MMIKTFDAAEQAELIAAWRLPEVAVGLAKTLADPTEFTIVPVSTALDDSSATITLNVSWRTETEAEAKAGSFRLIRRSWSIRIALRDALNDILACHTRALRLPDLLLQARSDAEAAAIGDQFSKNRSPMARF